MTLTRNSTKARRICFDAHKWSSSGGRIYLTCHICKCWIDVLKDPNGWEADHIRRHAEGGEDTAENLYPACVECHADKSAADTSDIAHGKRAGNKHFGIERKKKWWGR